jgi:plastocyanin
LKTHLNFRDGQAAGGFGYSISPACFARNAARVRRRLTATAVFAVQVGLMLWFVAGILNAQQTTLRAHAEVNRNGHRLKDASQVVIWLTPVGAPADPPRQTKIPKLVQKDKAFHPSLLVIPVGGEVEFPNEDPFFHNVFSLFEGKRFDLGLYESGTSQSVRFDKPGISFIFCNIHAQMSAVVIAVNTPYYAISNARGDLALPNVPPGRYQLQVFHASVDPDSLRALTHEITVNAGDSSLGTFTLTETEIELAHKNKYGRDYDRPDPDSPAYARP